MARNLFNKVKAKKHLGLRCVDKKKKKKCLCVCWREKARERKDEEKKNNLVY